MVFAMMLMAGSNSDLAPLVILRKVINLTFYMLVVYINLGYLILGT